MSCRELGTASAFVQMCPPAAVWHNTQLQNPSLGSLCRPAVHHLRLCPCHVQAHQQQQYGLLQDCQAHMGIVEAQAGGVFGSCFQLLSRVSEVDSMVRVLHLVTVMLEALGPKAQPHFAAITAALPQVGSLNSAV